MEILVNFILIGEILMKLLNIISRNLVLLKKLVFGMGKSMFVYVLVLFIVVLGILMKVLSIMNVSLVLLKKIEI